MPNICSAISPLSIRKHSLGASYRHYNGRHVQSLILSHNYLNNRNLKYRNNDDSSEDNLTLRLRSTEQKDHPAFRKPNALGSMDLKEGAELNNSIYTNHSRQRLYGSHSGTLSIYETSLDIFGWGLSSLPTIPPPTSVWPFLPVSVWMATLTTERCGSYGNSSPHASLHPTNSRNNGP